MRRQIDFTDAAQELVDDPTGAFKSFVERRTGLDFKDDIDEDVINDLAWEFLEDEAEDYELDEAEARQERALEEYENTHYLI